MTDKRIREKTINGFDLKTLLWYCAYPHYGQSIPEIEKNCHELRKYDLDFIIHELIKQGLMTYKLDDDDAYWITTSKAIKRYFL